MRSELKQVGVTVVATEENNGSKMSILTVTSRGARAGAEMVMESCPDSMSAKGVKQTIVDGDHSETQRPLCKEICKTEKSGTNHNVRTPSFTRDCYLRPASQCPPLRCRSTESTQAVRPSCPHRCQLHVPLLQHLKSCLFFSPPVSCLELSMTDLSTARSFVVDSFRLSACVAQRIRN